jgi:tRNA modification GTPase
MFCLDDTIAAIASTPGGGARGVVRLSGPDTLACLRLSIRSNELGEPPASPRPHVYGGELRGLISLPCDVYVWPSTSSYTRQPAAELHTFGSLPLLELVLQTICTHGARLARAGEFTLRAFLAGRLDLTQAEAVLGTIDADDDQALRTALDQLAGGLSSPLRQLRWDLLDLLADLEAGMDFVGEDIQFVSRNQVISRLSIAAGAVDRIKEQIGGRSASQPERRVVLAGSPNVGKSTLFNALVGREAAIASPKAGTTRDYLQAELELGTGKCLLVDTAGVNSAGPIEGIHAAAQRLADQQRAFGEIIVHCLDSSQPINDCEQQQLAARNGDIIVWTKCERPRNGVSTFSAIETSAFTGRGLDELRGAIASRLDDRASHGGAVASTAGRCKESIRSTREGIDRAIRLARSDAGDELVAAEIRLALGELGNMVGAVYTDDLLDRIFSRFCIGK